jgi:hypothetical protein
VAGGDSDHGALENRWRKGFVLFHGDSLCWDHERSAANPVPRFRHSGRSICLLATHKTEQSDAVRGPGGSVEGYCK